MKKFSVEEVEEIGRKQRLAIALMRAKLDGTLPPAEDEIEVGNEADGATCWGISSCFKTCLHAI